MPQRGAAKAAAAAPAAAARASDVGRGYWLELENALETINGHPLVHNMAGAEPCARQPGRPLFDNDIYQREIASRRFMAGGSLFWLDLYWSSTGVPLILQAAKHLSNTLFKEPTPYPGALHVAVTQGYSPLNHRGWLRGGSPEEIAHGMIFAASHAVRSEAGNRKP